MSIPTRKISFAAAIREATELSMETYPNVFLMGLGVDDPKAIFGTTAGLKEKFGERRVFDVPVSENALTGAALGAATVGMRPILTHQRIDFALLSLDQIINNAAKWHFMFGGQLKAPLVIRMIIGRGWGQGPQHSQSYQALFAHIPGLTVVMPATPHDAKGLLISSIEYDGPVIFLEHRWLHNIQGPVPSEMIREPLRQARIVRPGRDLTVVAASYMVFEAFRASEALARAGIEVEVVDLRTIVPLDRKTILDSVRRTGRLVVADTGHASFGISAEIITTVVEGAMSALKAVPRRVASPDFPAPTSHHAAKDYYPRASRLAGAILESLNAKDTDAGAQVLAELGALEARVPSDVPDLSFTGPF
jgi:pyruvate dehydrogenase E1 component beta subunit